jgi:hypothetical protein
MDIAVINQGSNNINILFGSGHRSILFKTNLYDTYLADSNKDGKVDLAVTNRVN